MKLIRLAAIGAAVAAAVVFAGVGRPESASSDTTPPQIARSITVSGSGTVTATPTQAMFGFGVSTRGKTAVQALNDDSAQMRKLIAALEGAGIPAASLQTSSVSLSPVTNNDETAIIGYTALAPETLERSIGTARPWSTGLRQRGGFRDRVPAPCAMAAGYRLVLTAFASPRGPAAALSVPQHAQAWKILSRRSGYPDRW